MRTFLLVLCLLATDALATTSWLGWLASLDPQQLPVPSPMLILVIGTLAFALTTFLLSSNWSVGAVRAITLAGAAGVTFMVLRPHLADALGMDPAGAPPTALLAFSVIFRTLMTRLVFTGAAVLYLWWRGTRCAAEGVSPMAARRTVSVNGIALAALALASRFSHPAPLGTAVVVGTAAGLTALALAQLEEVSSEVDGGQVRLSRSWLAMLAAVMAATGLLAVLFTSVAVRGAGQSLGAAFQPVSEALMGAVLFIIGILVQVATFILEPLANLLYLLLRGVRDPRKPQEQKPETNDLLKQWNDLVRMNPWLVLFLRVLVLAVIALFVARWLAGAVKRYNDRRTDLDQADEDAGLSLARIAADLRDAAQAAWRLLRQRVAAWGPGPGGVRRLYRELLAIMAEQGKMREADQTPYEYQPTPEAAVPGAAPQVAELTAAYVEARYGGRVPDEDAVGRLSAALEHIRAAAKGEGEDRAGPPSTQSPQDGH